MKKVLLISLGSIGKRHLRNTRSLLPDADIAVYRQHTRPGANTEAPEGGNHVFYSEEEALSFDPDAIIVSSPASEHVKNTVPFVKKNCHVFLEKPLAENHNVVEPLLQATKESTGFLMVGYVLRFLPVLHFMKKRISEGLLGKLHYARVEVGQYLPDWRPTSDYREGVSAQKALGGGALLELSHEIDYSTWLFGFPQSLMCSHGTISDLEIDVEDSASVIMEYPNDSLCKRVVLQLDFLQRVANMQVQIVGEKGTLRADLIKETARIETAENPNGIDLNAPKCVDGNELYLRQFDFFFHKAFSDYQPRFSETEKFQDWSTIDQAAQVLQLVDLSKLSNIEGRRVQLDG